MADTTKAFTIRVAPEAGIVLNNAARELREFFLNHEDAASLRITLGTAQSAMIKELLGPNPLKAAGGRRTRRIVRTSSGDLVVVGSDERAVLDGVFALEEWLLHGRLPAECDRTWSDVFSARLATHYASEPGGLLGSDEYRTFARQGHTHILANMVKHVFDHTYLHQLVAPRELSVKHDAEEIVEYQRLTNERIAIMKTWGIKPWFYVFEPAGPDVLGPAIPDEVVGRRYVYWAKKEVKTLCVHHPLVQRYYCSLIQDIIQAYPDVDILHFYCDDGSFWFCDPALCPCCAKHGGKLDHAVRHSVESHAYFLNLLQEAAREVKPGFSVGMSTIHLEDQIEKDPQGFMERLAPGAGIVHNPHYADGFLYEQPSANEWRTWKRLSKAGKKNGVPLFAWDEYNSSESLHMVKTLPTVYATAEKLANYAGKGVDALWLETRPDSGIYNPMNACFQLMVTGEIPDAQAAVHEAVRRSYGDGAAPRMQKALEALHAGMLTFNKDDLAIDLYIRFLLALNINGQLKIPVTPLAIERAVKESFFVYPCNGKREEGMRHWLPKIFKLAQAAIPHFEQAVAFADQGFKEGKLGATSAVLDHPELRERSSGDMVQETAHALRLWAALFKLWTHRLEGVQLVHMLNVYNDFQPPYMDEYRKAGEQIIRLAEDDCANLECLAMLIEATPDKREILKFHAHASERVSNPSVAADARKTLELTRIFLKDPWPEIYTFWQASQ